MDSINICSLLSVYLDFYPFKCSGWHEIGGEGADNLLMTVYYYCRTI